MLTLASLEAMMNMKEKEGAGILQSADEASSGAQSSLPIELTNLKKCL